MIIGSNFENHAIEQLDSVVYLVAEVTKSIDISLEKMCRIHLRNRTYLSLVNNHESKELYGEQYIV